MRKVPGFSYRWAGFRLNFSPSWRKRGRTSATWLGLTHSSQGRPACLYLLLDVFQILSKLHLHLLTEEPHVLPAPTKLTARIWQQKIHSEGYLWLCLNWLGDQGKSCLIAKDLYCAPNLKMSLNLIIHFLIS